MRTNVSLTFSVRLTPPLCAALDTKNSLLADVQYVTTPNIVVSQPPPPTAPGQCTKTTFGCADDLFQWLAQTADEAGRYLTAFYLPEFVLSD